MIDNQTQKILGEPDALMWERQIPRPLLPNPWGVQPIVDMSAGEFADRYISPAIAYWLDLPKREST